MAATPANISRAVWRKSTRSTAEGQNCVEVAALTTAIAVRDSKHPDETALIFDSRAWRAFANRVKHAQRVRSVG